MGPPFHYPPAPEQMQKLLIYLTFCAALGGCTAYAPPVEQGNLLDEEAVARLRPGMSEEQVRFLLGSPLLRDPFHRDRWDYLYWEERPGQPLRRRHLVLRFRDGRLAAVEERDGAQAPSGNRAPSPSPPGGGAPPSGRP